MRGIKIPLLVYRAKKHKIKIRYLVAAAALLTISPTWQKAQATGCPDLRVVFARGSGGELNRDANYLDFKNNIEERISGTGINYEFIDLDYPAVGVGVDNLGVTLGAYFGSGDSYEFGESVNSGVTKIETLINGSSCPNTKYVIGGYSQGAMVISKSLPKLNPERIIYAATFGDPKIYLPEGEGIMPDACKGKNLSDYRAYVPDCQAYKGLLGAYEPYEPEALIGKLGTWCNRRDIFCSSRLSINDHTSYISDHLYEDAAKVITAKIFDYFKIADRVASHHDTAILIDSTGSMSSMIGQYKEEAYRLAKETIGSGGRVALFEYRDLDDPFPVLERCNFDTCSLEKFNSELNDIKADGGGDTLESMLSASFNAMQSLEWKYGATKSLVVLTDAGFLSPDRDGVNIDDVIKLSKKIDPVNFYIITDPSTSDYYVDIADRTDGKVITNFNELNLLTDYIMERYDSLPRVEEDAPVVKPTLSIDDIKYEASGKATISFSSETEKTLVALNDRILGYTNEKKITIEGLDSSVKNVLSLVPISDEIRGDAVSAIINEANLTVTSPDILIPKAPNTGKAN